MTTPAPTPADMPPQTRLTGPFYDAIDFDNLDGERAAAGLARVERIVTGRVTATMRANRGHGQIEDAAQRSALVELLAMQSVIRDEVHAANDAAAPVPYTVVDRDQDPAASSPADHLAVAHAIAADMLAAAFTDGADQ